MDIASALLDSWDRQCRIVNSVASLVDEKNRQVKPSEDGWALDAQLAHIHQVRRYWLSQFAPERAKDLIKTVGDDWETPIDDLQKIKAALLASGMAVREAVRERLGPDLQPSGAYENPVLFLQHMVWHEGWHVGLLFLGLRLAGQDPTEEWSEAHVWGEWRTEELG